VATGPTGAGGPTGTTGVGTGTTGAGGSTGSGGGGTGTTGGTLPGEPGAPANTGSTAGYQIGPKGPVNAKPWGETTEGASMAGGYDAFRETFQTGLPSARNQFQLLARRGIGG
jgi:hypothetical protein